MAKQIDAPTKERMEEVTNFVMATMMNGFEEELIATLLDGKTFVLNKSVGVLMHEGKKIALKMDELVWTLMGYNPHRKHWGGLMKTHGVSTVKFLACAKIGEIVKKVVGDYTFFFNIDFNKKETERIDISTKIHVRGELESIQEKLRGGAPVPTRVTEKPKKPDVTSMPKSKALKYSDVVGTPPAYESSPLTEVKKERTMLAKKMMILEAALKEAEENEAMKRKVEEMERKLAALKAPGSRCETPMSDIASLVSEMENSGEKWGDK